MQHPDLLLQHPQCLKHTLATCAFNIMSPCCSDEWTLVVAELDADVEFGGKREGRRRRIELAAARRSAAHRAARLRFASLGLDLSAADRNAINWVWDDDDDQHSSLLVYIGIGMEMWGPLAQAVSRFRGEKIWGMQRRWTWRRGSRELDSAAGSSSCDQPVGHS